MKEIFTLAYRNLTRQKRRSIILAIAIAFGFFVVTAIDGLASGAVNNLENQITQLIGGTVLISGYKKLPPEGEKDNGKLINIIEDHDYIQNIVDELGVKYDYVSQYTNTTSQLLFNGKKLISNVYGRDFNDKEFSSSLQFVEGSIEDCRNADSIILSQNTAEALKVQVGDQILFTCSTIYGQNEVADFTVGAIVQSSSFLSGMNSYVNIEALNSIIQIPEGGYNTFTIFLTDKNDQFRIAQKIEDRIRADGEQVSSRAEAFRTNPSNINSGINKQFIPRTQQWEGIKYGVVSLNDQIPALQQVMSIVHLVTTVILIVILLIVMVGISNTYRMILYERIREIGTMRALGMEGKDTGKLFTTEAVILCVMGAAAGLILAVLVMFILTLIPIHNESVAIFLHGGHLTFRLSPGAIIFQYILVMILTALAVRGTAKKASHMSPAEALRTIK